MVTRFNSKYTIILLHAAIWSLLLILPHFFIPGDTRNIKPGFFPGSYYVITNFYHIGLFYINAFVIYPLFFNRRKWWFFVLVNAAIVIGSFYLKIFIVRHWYPEVVFNLVTHFSLFFPALVFIVISTIYRLIVDKMHHDKKQKEIAAEQLAIKLKFLRSQISPHFIFNVLANLVSLARKRSDQMEQALIMLSDLMRYMLYESDEKRVNLSTEIDYLKSYIELQKLRFGNDVLILVNIDLPETQTNYNIEPMLLIPFVENAFKHGLAVDEPLIAIKLSIYNGKLEFEVENKFSTDANESKDENSGIGLENVRSRLALLYPAGHNLLITKENKVFHIHLTMQLK